MTAAEQIIWAAWKDGRDTYDICLILNQIPELICGTPVGERFWHEARVHKILIELKACERRGDFYDRSAA